MANKRAYREVIGERLKEMRESRGLSAYKVAQVGEIRIEQVQAIESGETNYTVDSFFGYIRGCDLYMYFAEKSPERKEPHDFDDMLRQSIRNDPNNAGGGN